MEDYEYKVSNCMQLCSRIVANLLVISNITSKSTSETDQIRFRGPWGGLTPYAGALLGRLYSRSPKRGSVGIRAVPLGLAQGPAPPPIGGNTLARRLAGGCSPIPWCILPDGPPKCSGTVRGSRRASSPIYSDFLGRTRF